MKTEAKFRSFVGARVVSKATSHPISSILRSWLKYVLLSPTACYFNLDMNFRFLHLTSETVRYLTDNFPRLRRIGGLETWNPRTCDRESLNLVLASRPPSKTKFHLTTWKVTTQQQNLTKNVDKILTGTESLPRSLPGTAALQPMMDAKLNDKRFWYYHGKGHVKTNQTISHNHLVIFKSDLPSL